MFSDSWDSSVGIVSRYTPKDPVLDSRNRQKFSLLQNCIVCLCVCMCVCVCGGVGVCVWVCGVCVFCNVWVFW